MHYTDCMLPRQLGVMEIEEDHEAMEDSEGSENRDIVAEHLYC